MARNDQNARRPQPFFSTAECCFWRLVACGQPRPGKPTDNGFIEAFNSKLRAECLNAHWFLTLEDAREKLENWRRHYNEDRPHSAIGYNVPIALHNPDGVISPPLA